MPEINCQCKFIVEKDDAGGAQWKECSKGYFNPLKFDCPCRHFTLKT